MRASLPLLAGLLVAVVAPQVACGSAAGPAPRATPSPATRCSAVVAPGDGLQRFVSKLGPGAVGCLRPGTYEARKLTLRRSGTPRKPIVLRSLYPSRPATIKGSVWVTNAANYVTVESLRLVGASSLLPTVIVNGDHSTWNRIDVSNPPATATQGGGICISLGQLERWGYAGSTTIENSLIHDCGLSTNTNQGIYIQATSGRTVIRNNWIFRNGDRGVQLYPAARDVEVTHNVIDGNGSGVIFSGDGRNASSGNTVALNIISNSRIRWNVESSFPDGSVGQGNIVSRNCLWASGPDLFYATDGGVAPAAGYEVSHDNVVERPRFRNAAGGDLRLARRSGCRGFGPTAQRVPGPGGGPLGTS